MGSVILPPAPAEEEKRDACCPACGSLWHSAAGHPVAAATEALVGLVAAPEFPVGYDPAEADRLIGRDPHAT